MSRLAFLARMLARRLAGQERGCPFCRSADTVLEGRRRLVLELRRCRACGILFRWPKEDAATAHRFYQRAYREGMTTEMPDAAALARLLAAGFAGSNRDLSVNVACVKAAGGAGRLLDFGCSWGYGVHQFRRAGFDAVGYEISAPRAAYARERLGLAVIDSPAALDGEPPGSFDVIHTAHVLEHLTDPAAALTAIARLLRPGGLLAIFVPNAGGDEARAEGAAWGPMINTKHLLAFDAAFFARNLPPFGFTGLRYSSLPHDRPPVADAAAPLPGPELLVLARRTDERP